MSALFLYSSTPFVSSASSAFLLEFSKFLLYEFVCIYSLMPSHLLPNDFNYCYCIIKIFLSSPDLFLELQVPAFDLSWTPVSTSQALNGQNSFLFLSQVIYPLINLNSTPNQVIQPLIHPFKLPEKIRNFRSFFLSALLKSHI